MATALYILAAYLVIGNVGLVWSMRSRPAPGWVVAALFVAAWPAVAWWTYREWVRS